MSRWEIYFSVWQIRSLKLPLEISEEDMTAAAHSFNVIEDDDDIELDICNQM